MPACTLTSIIRHGGLVATRRRLRVTIAAASIRGTGTPRTSASHGRQNRVGIRSSRSHREISCRLSVGSPATSQSRVASRPWDSPIAWRRRSNSGPSDSSGGQAWARMAVAGGGAGRTDMCRPFVLTFRSRPPVAAGTMVRDPRVPPPEPFYRAGTTVFRGPADPERRSGPPPAGRANGPRFWPLPNRAGRSWLSVAGSDVGPVRKGDTMVDDRRPAALAARIANILGGQLPVPYVVRTGVWVDGCGESAIRPAAVVTAGAGQDDDRIDVMSVGTVVDVGARARSGSPARRAYDRAGLRCRWRIEISQFPGYRGPVPVLFVRSRVGPAWRERFLLRGTAHAVPVCLAAGHRAPRWASVVVDPGWLAG